MKLVAVCLLITTLFACVSQNRPAHLLDGAGPIYPPGAMQDGVEGFVRVLYDIEVDGRVTNLAVIESEPPGVFDSAALQAVTSWRFNPRIVAGQAVAARRKLSTVTFQLSGSDAYDRYE